jgi:hypothetical protein
MAEVRNHNPSGEEQQNGQEQYYSQPKPTPGLLHFHASTPSALSSPSLATRKNCEVQATMA